MRNFMRAVRPLSVTTILLVVMGVVFGLQWLDESRWEWGISDYFAITRYGLKRNWWWQLFTYQFLHGGYLHLAMNGITLWSFGRIMEQVLGRRRFLVVYFGSALAGGLLQGGLMLMFPDRFFGYVMGASAGVAGIMAVFAWLAPDLKWQLFLFLPVRARTALWLGLGVSLLFTVWPRWGGHVAHAAHLGGMLGGLALMGRDLRKRLRLQPEPGEAPPQQTSGTASGPTNGL